MPDPATGERRTRRSPLQPNFLMVVILAAIALILVGAIAWLVVDRSGRHMLAPTHPDPEPNSALHLPDQGIRSA